MSEIQPDQNNNNNDNDKKEENEPKEEKSEEELLKEIQETKRKLYQLYGQQWKLKVQKYKEWKEQQQQKNPDSDDDNNNNNNNDNKNNCGQRRLCHQWGCHGWRCGGWGQYSPYYRWWQCSQQQPQANWGGCEQRFCQHQCKCEKKNDEESKPNQELQNESPRRCHPHHHCQPYWMWWHWTQKRRQTLQQQQQEQPQCQSQCPNWRKCQKPEECSKPCQSPCGECPKRHHCCHRFPPGACWLFWAQRQRQMQQQNACSSWWPCEGRRRCMTPNQPPCGECPRRRHCHQHCPPQWRWWFWQQRQMQMQQQQQQQWLNWWAYQWPQQCQSPCNQGFSPAWFWWARAERQRQMRRRWLRWLMWKKYTMLCRCQRGMQDNDKKGMRCCHRFKCCGKPGCCKINQQKENDKKEDEKQESQDQDSQQVFEEEEEN
ncbi:hypothetical protein M9Y10_027616 [Tritrichomonas musculus]|uniref:Uncharacterized protein n=1 Tax=Tritrichomonas musculus TaxID=1915356 RepID=A0ABR2H3I5_9EUKA